MGLAGSASAETGTITIALNHPEQIEIVRQVYNYETYTSEEFPVFTTLQEVNTLDFDTEDYTNNTLYIRAKQDYRLSSVLLNNVEQLYSAEPTESFYLNLSSATDGSVYEVTSFDLAAERTSTFTINVDNASRLRLARKDYSEVTLQNGANTVPFHPVYETQFRLTSTDNNPIMSVKVNNTDVADTGSGAFEFTVADNDVVDVTADFPNEFHTVKLTVPEGSESVVSSFVNGNYEPIEGNVLEGVSLKAGTKFQLQFNSTTFKLAGLTVNGVAVENFYGSYTGVVRDADINLVLDAHPYQSFDVNFNVDDAEHVTIYNGSSSWDTPFEIVTGDNTLSFTEKSYGPFCYIKAAQGYLVDVFRSNNGGEDEAVDASTFFTVAMGDAFRVHVYEKVPDSKFRVWVDEAALGHIADFTLNKGWNDNVAVVSSTDIHAGINEIPFCSVDLPFTFQVNVQHPAEIPEGYMPWQPVVFRNDLSEAGNYIFISEWSETELMRVYYETPEVQLVSVALGDGTEASRFSITADTQAVEDWSAPFSAFPGSDIAVTYTAPEDDEYIYTASVQLDGNDLTADENGVFTFKVSGAHTLTLAENKEVGIGNVAADALVDGPVYNLQGIKVADNAAALSKLPAGVYIANGKKVVVNK